MARVSAAAALAFCEVTNRVLDEMGYKDKYYWDDGAWLDDNTLPVTKKLLPVSDWIGFLVFNDGVEVPDKIVYPNGVTVRCMEDDPPKYYAVDDMFEAFSAQKVEFTLQCVLPVETLSMFREALAELLLRFAPIVSHRIIETPLVLEKSEG